MGTPHCPCVIVRVFSKFGSEAEEGECGLGTTGVGAQRGGDVGVAGPPQGGDGRAPQRRHHLWAGPGAHLAAVLVERHVADPVEFVLDAPVPPPQRQESGRVRLVRGQAGDRVAPFDGGLALAGDLAFDRACLRHGRPAEVPGVRQGRRGQQGAPLVAVAVPPVADGLPEHLARRRVSEQRAHVVEQVGLVVLDRPDVVSAPPHHQAAQVLLAELGIAGDHQPRHVQAAQQRLGQRRLVLPQGAPF